jgi:FkbM family methyltransferase
LGQTGTLFLHGTAQEPVLLRLRGKIPGCRSQPYGRLVCERDFPGPLYTRYGTEIEPHWTIVDIGAAIGEFTVFAAQKAAQGKVLAFEPNSASFALLQENLKLNSIGNAQAVNAGVWNRAGAMTLDAANGEPLQAQTQFSETAAVSGQSVPVITLGQLLEEFAPEGIDLLKLDCEGAEYPILFSASPETLGAVKRIIMEYHELDAQQSHQKLAEHLQNAGFQVRLHANPVHAEIGYLYAWHTP